MWWHMATHVKLLEKTNKMVEHEKFVFLHLQKCGGTFVGTFLYENVFGCKWNPYDKHRTLNVKPKNKFVFGVVRNPFDWYVSWYYSIRSYNPPYGDIMYPATTMAKKCESFIEFMNHLYQNTGDLLDFNFDSCNEKKIGVYTFRHNNIFQNHLDFTCRFENLNDDLIRCFNVNGFPFNEKQIERLRGHKKVNTSIHSHYSDYYDDKTEKLVRERDVLFINKYGYEFENN